MNLYLISQEANDGYDTYDSAIVCASSFDEAREINPSGHWGRGYSGWCATPSQVTVVKIGTADDGVDPGVVLASFNAG